MRSTLEPQAVITVARRILKAVAPDVPPRFRTFEQIYAASLSERRFNLILVTTFAGTALLLAVAGIYGVMSLVVAQRRREFGLRVALGASRRQVLRIIAGQGLTTTAIGVIVGVVVAVGLSQAVERLLFDIAPTDLVTFAGVVVVVTGTAMLACCEPAWRAITVEPLEALREP